jgi:putative Holliday junction resolvase
MGFDVGLKRTGVAIANSLTNKANGLEVVKHHKNGTTNWQSFDKIITVHNANLFIVGLPLDKNDKEQEMTFVARSFAKKLTKRYNIQTEFISEYLSSYDAKNQLKWSHKHPNAQRGIVDKRAAELILQTWLNEYNKAH